MNSTLMIVALTIGAPGLKDPPKKHPDIVGDWVAVMIVQNGHTDPNPDNLRHTFTAKGQWIVVRDGAELEGGNRGYTLDPKASPATVDFSLDRAESSPPLRGIFSMKGDTMTLCVAMQGESRPTEFASPKGSQIALIVFKRVKKE